MSTWVSKGFRCKRENLPLVPAYGFTFHKSQGTTLTSVVVDIGEKEAQLGLTYVAFSRVREWETLALVKSYDFSRFRNIGSSHLMTLRKREEARLANLNNN